MVDLQQTSVPPWALVPEVQTPDPGGRRHTVLVVGGEREGAAAAVADEWVATLTAAAEDPDAVGVRRLECADAAEAVEVVAEVLRDAVVGHRLLVAGSADDCLAVRGVALAADLLPEELCVGVVDVGTRTVACLHCAATTRTRAAIEDVVTCSGCDRSLIVYPHVSRRTGHHLGFMVDAEDQPWALRDEEGAA